MTRESPSTEAKNEEVIALEREAVSFPGKALPLLTILKQGASAASDREILNRMRRRNDPRSSAHILVRYTSG